MSDGPFAAVLAFLYLYLGIGTVAVILHLIDSLLFHRREWTDDNIKSTLENGLSYDPARQMIIEVIGNRVGVCIVILLTWPFGLYLWIKGDR